MGPFEESQRTESSVLSSHLGLGEPGVDRGRHADSAREDHEAPWDIPAGSGIAVHPKQDPSWGHPAGKHRSKSYFRVTFRSLKQATILSDRDAMAVPFRLGVSIYSTLKAESGRAPAFHTKILHAYRFDSIRILA